MCSQCREDGSAGGLHEPRQRKDTPARASGPEPALVRREERVCLQSPAARAGEASLPGTFGPVLNVNLGAGSHAAEPFSVLLSPGGLHSARPCWVPTATPPSAHRPREAGLQGLS